MESEESELRSLVIETLSLILRHGGEDAKLQAAITAVDLLRESRLDSSFALEEK